MKYLLAFAIATFTLIGNSSDTNLVEFYNIKSAKTYNHFFYQVRDQLYDDHKIAAHHWSNNRSELIVMVPGYTDNCGYTKPLHEFLISLKVDVLCIELPGHGESSGDRGDIKKMEVYLDVYKSIFPKIFDMKYEKISFLAHSTGNIGMVEYLLNNEDSSRFDNIIFVAPLIRSYLWKLSKFGLQIAGWWLKRLPKISAAAKNPRFKMLRSLDPNPIKSVPINWYKQLIAWNKNLQTNPRSSNVKIKVIQATNDMVVDNRFNKKFITNNFINSEFEYIKYAHHSLHWEDDEKKNQYFNILKKFLNK